MYIYWNVWMWNNFQIYLQFSYMAHMGMVDVCFFLLFDFVDLTLWFWSKAKFYMKTFPIVSLYVLLSYPYLSIFDVFII